MNQCSVFNFARYYSNEFVFKCYFSYCFWCYLLWTSKIVACRRSTVAPRSDSLCAGSVPLHQQLFLAMIFERMYRLSTTLHWSTAHLYLFSKILSLDANVINFNNASACLRTAGTAICAGGLLRLAGNVEPSCDCECVAERRTRCTAAVDSDADWIHTRLWHDRAGWHGVVQQCHQTLVWSSAR
jgi:hypothetical protein